MSIDFAPCPWCGSEGRTELQEDGRVWNGWSYSKPVSVSVRHWCKYVPGKPSHTIVRVGRDQESAIAAWNNRHKEPTHEQ